MESHPIKNRVEEASGKIKEVTGKVFGNKSLENRGTIEKIDGKVKVQIDQIKNDGSSVDTMTIACRQELKDGTAPPAAQQEPKKY